jgi:hypothetical protein
VRQGHVAPICGLAAQDIQQQLDHTTPDLVGRLADGGQRRIEIAGETDIIEADHRYVIRTLQPPVTDRRQRAHGHLVIEAEQRRGR